jgi:hypothetical protein
MKASVKAHAGVVEKLESKMGRHNGSILKLQQEMHGTVKNDPIAVIEQFYDLVCDDFCGV